MSEPIKLWAIVSFNEDGTPKEACGPIDYPFDAAEYARNEFPEGTKWVVVPFTSPA